MARMNPPIPKEETESVQQTQDITIPVRLKVPRHEIERLTGWLTEYYMGISPLPLDRTATPELAEAINRIHMTDTVSATFTVDINGRFKLKSLS